jgi:hypothetical protein
MSEPISRLHTVVQHSETSESERHGVEVFAPFVRYPIAPQQPEAFEFLETSNDFDNAGSELVSR